MAGRLVSGASPVSQNSKAGRNGLNYPSLKLRPYRPNLQAQASRTLKVESFSAPILYYHLFSGAHAPTEQKTDK